jgi:hypothetical protein
MVEGQKQLETTSLDEAEQFKLAKEQEGGYNVTIKRHWYMDELITQEDSNESK